MAKTYRPITEDNTVCTIEEVQIEEAEDVVDKSTMTLAYLDTEIAVKTTGIAAAQSELAELQATRALVSTEAGKVVLKEKEPEPVIL